MHCVVTTTHSPAAPTPRLSWLPVFDSGPLPQADRYAFWRDADIAGLSSHYETTPHEPFTATMDWLDLGLIGVGQARVTAQDWDRTRAKTKDDFDHVVVNVRHAGAAHVEAGDRRVIAPAGSIVLTDMSRPMWHASEASFSTGFALPRALAEQLFPSLDAVHGHVIPPEQAALFVGHLALIRETSAHLPASAGPVLAQTILDLLAMSVAASFDSAPVDRHQHERALRVQLRDTIERNLGSPSLGTARLSRELGVSRSTLFRLLRDRGGVQAYIRERRLARVAETLREGRDRQTIAVIAERWGFCDAAYLGRAFREAYGMTPGDYRAQHASRTADIR